MARSAAALSDREGLALGPPRRLRLQLRCAAERAALLALPRSHERLTPPGCASGGRRSDLGSRSAHPLSLSSCRRSCATLSCSADRSRSDRLSFIGAKAALN